MKKNVSDRLFFQGLCLILLIGLIISYSNHFNNSFHFDDDHSIVNNPWIKSITNIPKFYSDATTSSSLPQNQGYRPGQTTLNAIDYWVATKNPLNIDNKDQVYQDKGLNTFYFHLSIFFFFLLQAVLMFLLFKKLLDLSQPHRWNKYFSLFMVAFYCFHTATAETINYISVRSDSFSTFMVLLSMVIFVYYPKKRKYGFFLLPYIYGFLVKEPALMLGPILFFYVLLFEKQADLTKLFTKETIRKIWLSLLAVLSTIAVGIALYAFYIRMRPPTWLPSTLSTWDYLITQPFVVVQYFKTFLLPTELSADTDWAALSTILAKNSALGYRMLFMGLIFIIGMIWLAVRVSRKKELRPVTFGIFWFFIALLPSSSFIPLSEMLNDHRIYFPFVGLVLAFFTFIFHHLIIKYESSILQATAIKTIIILVGAGLLTGHAYGTFQRNKVWKDEESLWLDVTRKSPANGRGMMNYGLSQMRKGNYKTAKEYFEKALVYSPLYSLLHINLAVLYSATGDKVNAEKYYKSAIACNQYVDQAYYYYGSFLYGQKRYEEARQYLKNAISINPNYTEPRLVLMEIYSLTEDWGLLSDLASETLTLLPNDPQCLTYLDAAKNKKTKLEIAKEIALGTPTSDNFINLSLRYYEEGMYTECISACEEAIKLKPDNAIAYNNICSAYNALKQFDKAIEACTKALNFDSTSNLATGNLNYAKSQLK